MTMNLEGRAVGAFCIDRTQTMKAMGIKDGSEASSLSVRRTGVSSAKMANDRARAAAV